jgi:hypothetical protein
MKHLWTDLYSGEEDKMMRMHSAPRWAPESNGALDVADEDNNMPKGIAAHR